jgi:hypothetical protein
MSVPKSYKGVRTLYDAQPDEIRRYFEHLPYLITSQTLYDVALAYLFSRVERAHRRALYCGITKRHAANSEFTDEVVRKEYLTRAGFKTLFKAVFDEDFPDSLSTLIEHAEQMRDTGMHGRETSDADMRRAIHDVFAYAREFNALVNRLEGFQPFGDLRGFKGRAESLEKRTTRWILKGMGFSVA